MLLLLETGQSPRLTPPLFNGLSQESTVGAALPPPPINVTVRVYDAVCADGWVWRLSPLDRAAWATNLTKELGGAPSRLCVVAACAFLAVTQAHRSRILSPILLKDVASASALWPSCFRRARWSSPLAEIRCVREWRPLHRQ